MIGSWEMDRLCESRQLFEFSRAYLKSSISLCPRIQRLRRMPRYPEATVLLFLARHAVELFLKGAIIARSPNAKLDHDLERLKSMYDKLYTEQMFSWVLPFTTEYPGMTSAQILVAKKHIPPGEQVYRYPIDRAGAKWNGIFALEPLTFQRDMRAIGKEMARLAQRILAANKAP